MLPHKKQLLRRNAWYRQQLATQQSGSNTKQNAGALPKTLAVRRATIRPCQLNTETAVQTSFTTAPLSLNQSLMQKKKYLLSYPAATSDKLPDIHS